MSICFPIVNVSNSPIADFLRSAAVMFPRSATSSILSALFTGAGLNLGGGTWGGWVGGGTLIAGGSLTSSGAVNGGVISRSFASLCLSFLPRIFFTNSDVPFSPGGIAGNSSSNFIPGRSLLFSFVAFNLARTASKSAFSF